jgi:hypothetical protein
MNECNSRIIADHFVSRWENPCRMERIEAWDPNELADLASTYETLLIIMPLYIHAMPGVVMKFFEYMKPALDNDRSLGFIVQAGFMETAQHRYLAPYLEHLAKKFGYRYLGYVAKGEAAGIYMFPKMFKKVLRRFAELGEAFERTGEFVPEIVKTLSEPYELSKGQLRLLRVIDAIGLSNIGWHSKLRKHGALKQRLDRPYL